ncbi:MAG: SpoIIIAH-like family protein [Acutalibacteraceae bacterium]|nr:SpoIIIAH-like family protein [Acutalibacteraceae bacterium]
MKLGKRQLILTGLVLTLGAAVYLNWQFSSNTDLLTGASPITVSKELGEAEFVNTSSDKKAGTSSSKKSDSKPDEATASTKSKASQSSNEFFAKAKLNREETQDKIAEMTKEVLNAAEESDAAKTEAVTQAALLATTLEQQSNIESLVLAKGFQDCLAFIQNDECSIVVKDSSFTDEKALIIKDIVTGQTGIAIDKIKINAVK